MINATRGTSRATSTYLDAQEEREGQGGDDQYHRDDRQQEGAQVRAIRAGFYYQQQIRNLINLTRLLISFEDHRSSSTQHRSQSFETKTPPLSSMFTIMLLSPLIIVIILCRCTQNYGKTVNVKNILWVVMLTRGEREGGRATKNFC